ncbi:hypothetical protein TRIUR3_31192 [Triticum urartu]|uniref:Uncharacterized protein n=1 Tax=Triticum urartu TaxID=4572 RepID=M7ZH28_TRIUA|nr:hypothetical protein TRIUR3_31192 [Triticum urartu]
MAPTSRISHCPHVAGAPCPFTATTSGRSTPPPEAVHRSRTLDPAATMSLSCCSMAQLLYLVEGRAFPLWNGSVHEIGAEKEDGICWLRWRVQEEEECGWPLTAGAERALSLASPTEVRSGPYCSTTWGSPRFPPLEPLRPTAAHGGGVRRVHQSNPMALGRPSFVAAISSNTCITTCVATTAIRVTACSVTGLLRTVTPAALLPLPEAARALPGLISCCSDELLYIAEIPYLLNGTSTTMQQLG